MDISQYEIIVTEHAIIQAFEREVDADTLEGIVRNCKKKAFGKHYAKWTNICNDREIICVGYIENNIIRILTVETK